VAAGEVTDKGRKMDLRCWLQGSVMRRSLFSPKNDTGFSLASGLRDILQVALRLRGCHPSVRASSEATTCSGKFKPIFG
jgi:hypothetical protein